MIVFRVNASSEDPLVRLIPPELPANGEHYTHTQPTQNTAANNEIKSGLDDPKYEQTHRGRVQEYIHFVIVKTIYIEY